MFKLVDYGLRCEKCQRWLLDLKKCPYLHLFKYKIITEEDIRKKNNHNNWLNTGYNREIFNLKEKIRRRKNNIVKGAKTHHGQPVKSLEELKIELNEILLKHKEITKANKEKAREKRNR